MEIRAVNFLVWTVSVCVLVYSEDPRSRQYDEDLNSPRHRTTYDTDATCKSPTRRPDPIPVVNPMPESIQAGDPKRCSYLLNDKRIIRYETLPGNGWDNLRNKDAGVVVNFNYTRCKTTDDGRYIIPDTVYTIPLKSSTVETFAELFDHWLNYTSTTSNSINIAAGLTLTHFGISGKFSAETENVRSHQINDKSVTTRVQVRYVRYTARLQPDTPLHPSFKARLLSIAAHLQLNNTNMATYESELLVRDFGTHVVTSVDSGAALVQVDDIKSSFSRDYSASKSRITASASASFFSVFKVSAGFDHQTTNEMINQYLGNRSSSKIETFGGPVFKPVNFSLNDWADSIGDDLVALDRSGDPLYFVITPYSLPELPHSVVYKLIQSVKSAIELYYKFNIYRGCTNRDSPNFSFQANVDDGTCKAPNTNFTFGGVYQTCITTGELYTDLCQGLRQKNPLSGDFKCPGNYEPVLLESSRRTGSETRQQCSHSWWSGTRCHDYTVYGMADYVAYWCVALGNVPAQNGFLFGGIYTSTVSNPLTQTKACPLFFYPLNIGSDMKVCVSDDYELGFQYSVPFAGFYSCKNGNPLMHRAVSQSNKLQASANVHTMGSFFRSSQENWPKGCPNGYSQHMANVENGCEIDYCVKADAFSAHGLPPIRQPPFMPLPEEGFTDSLSYTISRDGQTWSMIENAETDKSADKMVSKPTSDSNTSGDSGLTKGGVAGISVGVTIACLLVAFVAIMKYRKYKSQYRPLHMSAPLSRDRSVHSKIQYGTTQNDQQSEVLVET